jgi:nicotinate-nucleotide adenylyltransferase
MWRAERVSEQRWGLFGGSFDPIHRGHIAPVQEAREALGLERVLYLPTALPPHKPKAALAPPLARYAMVELALLEEPGLFVSPHELTLGQPAYTVETIRAFQSAHPDIRWYLLLGGDSFVELVHWRSWRDILDTADIVVLARPGWSTLAADLPAELRPHFTSARVHVLQTTPVAASSTRLRELLRQRDELPGGWVPPLVVDYIRKYNLYR